MIKMHFIISNDFDFITFSFLLFDMVANKKNATVLFFKDYVYSGKTSRNVLS